VHIKDKGILEKLQRYFGGIGTITNNGPSMVIYQVTSLEDLVIIINQPLQSSGKEDWIDKYPLLSYKAVDYNFSKEAHA
jgi:hypothetical protein